MDIFAFAVGPYKTNCYVMVSGDKATVIDPGMHSFDTLKKYFDEHDVSVEQVFLTHGHVDHTRDAATVANYYGIPVYIHREDAFMLDKGNGSPEESRVLFDVDTMVKPHNLRFYEDGDRMKIGDEEFVVHYSPGHSPGCIMLEGKSFVFSGDVLFKGSIGRTDFPHSSPEKMKETLQKKVMGLSDELQVLPGHGPTTTVRAEKRTNPFLAEFA